MAAVAERLGVRAAPGGKPPGLGTHSALLALGESTYISARLHAAGPPRRAPAAKADPPNAAGA